MISRRGLFRAAGGAGLALAAPAIIRTAGLLMPTKPLPPPLSFVIWEREISFPEWNPRYFELLEKAIRAPITEAMQDLIVFGQSITRVAARGLVRVPPAEWHRSLPDDLVHKLESVPLK